MAFTCGFYNSVNHDRKYDAVQHGMIFDGIITDGIYATYLKAMVVKASSNPSEVIVQPGRAWFNHTWSYNDADYPVAAPDPEVVLDRIDTLVLDINSEDAVRDNQFLWVQGTPTSQVPEPPELIHTATHNQYPLCDVYRQAGTTQIYAADITNRVGTSDCPFVTGVLEGINIDDLLAQWDDEFHTWENATKASFEGWMLNQQAVYTAWWDALKTQMAGDVDDVEEWIQTIKDIIDEETATHLQLEIDEINSMLPSGSHITVTTTDTELYSRTVTITDEDNNTVTSQFDATGVAVFKSVPYVGNLTIEATDGIRTATAVVNTPYFARYEFPLAFWSATVNITSDTELGGETVTVTDSSQVLVGTVVLNASGAGVFNATYPDTYKFSVTHGGQTMEVSLAVTQETTYNVTIHAGFNWRGWVDTARDLDSSDYDSLEEVLADELAVRELCLEHACVDYLAAVPSVNSDIETIINNDLFAKWANNSDYSLDVLGANVAIKALMDTADKYGYGEWIITDDTTTPPTWGAKGNVPVMTSNTAPYGECISNGTDGTAHNAFDNNDSTESSNSSYGTSGGQRLGYKFANPVNVKKLHHTSAAGATDTIKVQYSDDGTTWTDTGDTFTNTQSVSGGKDVDVTDSGYHLYWAIYCTGSTITSRMSTYTLQFYGRELSVSNPAMTGFTTPYGTVTESRHFESSQYGNHPGWQAFDKNANGQKGWQIAYTQSATTSDYLQYVFNNPFNISFIRIYQNKGIGGETVYSLMGIKDDDTLELIQDITQTMIDEYKIVLVADKLYKGIKIVPKSFTSYNQIYFYEIEIFGKDYSEKEFEEGTTKKWLYDHGLELEPIENTALLGTLTKGADSMILTTPSSGVSRISTSNAIDITSYSLERMKLGKNVTLYSDTYTCSLSLSGTRDTVSLKGFANSLKALLPNNVGLDISSVNESVYPWIHTSNFAVTCEITEWWLE